jgi:hypothetical protein
MDGLLLIYRPRSVHVSQMSRPASTPGVPLEDLSYLERRRRFRLSPLRAELPRFLYKFRRLAPADAKSVDRLRDVLVRSRLWFSSAADFNDPFDMSARFIAKGTPAERTRRLHELLERVKVKLDQEEFQGTLGAFLDASDARIAEVAATGHVQAIEESGVYSFAGDPRSILMWSHYGDEHGGLCLQFEVVKDLNTFLKAERVKYSDEYPVVNWVTGFPEALYEAILRKHYGWSYERETRIVMPDLAKQYLSFRPEALQGIIIGCRAKLPIISKLRELLKERSAVGHPAPRLYRAVKHQSRYKLVIKALRDWSGA